MADSTPHKRVLPARERRESAAKRRAISPVIQSSPALSTTPGQSAEPRQKRKYTKRGSTIKVAEAAPSSSKSTPAAEEVLPYKLVASKPLPIAREKQSDKLSTREYQTIAESATLSASLHRSRMQWLCDGIFKRYWVKPVKRKGVIEQPAGNPDAKSMQKLGNATITIEPHVFEATFYMVKDTTTILQPVYRHPNQHNAKPAFPVQRPSLLSPVQQTSSSPAAANPTPQQNLQHVQPVKQEDSTQKKPTPTPTPTPINTPLATPQTTRLPATTPLAVPPPNGPPKPSDDPVIQMLAARAATDSRLKELMKVVAMSQATPDQLREFQSHIDEFNTIIKQQGIKKVENKSSPATPITNPSTPRPVVHNNTNSRGPAPSASHAPGMGGSAHMPAPYMAYPPTLPPPRPEPIIKHIVIEFHSQASGTQGPSTDRWLFPEHAVLEMKAGGTEMIASFFVKRKGEDVLKRLGLSEGDDEGLRQKYKPEQQYFQPVTMLIKASQHRTIETIARAARPLVEVQKHMREVMEQQTRAPQEFLVHRLPRDKALDTDKVEFVDSGVEVSEAEDDELKDFYGM